MNISSLPIEIQMYINNISEKDIIKSISGIPIEIIKVMLYYQYLEENVVDITIFQKNRTDGFCWGKTKEGHSFWSNIINDRKFNTFYKKYPEKLFKNTSFIKKRTFKFKPII